MPPFQGFAYMPCYRMYAVPKVAGLQFPSIGGVPEGRGGSQNEINCQWLIVNCQLLMSAEGRG